MEEIHIDINKKLPTEHLYPKCIQQQSPPKIIYEVPNESNFDDIG